MLSANLCIRMALIPYFANQADHQSAWTLGGGCVAARDIDAPKLDGRTVLKLETVADHPHPAPHAGGFFEPVVHTDHAGAVVVFRLKRKPAISRRLQQSLLPVDRLFRGGFLCGDYRSASQQSRKSHCDDDSSHGQTTDHANPLFFFKPSFFSLSCSSPSQAAFLLRFPIRNHSNRKKTGAKLPLDPFDLVQFDFG